MPGEGFRPGGPPDSCARAAVWKCGLRMRTSLGFCHLPQRLIQHARLVPATRLPPPAKPPARVAQRLDFALFAAINNSHRDEFDFLSGSDESAEQFRFNLEMVRVQVGARPGIQ